VTARRECGAKPFSKGIEAEIDVKNGQQPERAREIAARVLIERVQS
jgi:2-phosphoglycerate kinase